MNGGACELRVGGLSYAFARKLFSITIYTIKRLPIKLEIDFSRMAE